MFSTQSTYGFASGYPKYHVFDKNGLYSRSQGYLGVQPNVLGGWYTSAHNSEVNPWAWQWNERMGVQEACDTSQSPGIQYIERASLWQGHFSHHSYTTSITQQQVHPTYAVDQAPPAFSRVVGGPVFNTNKPEIVCPRPIRPLPKWVTVKWEDEEEETTPKEDEERSTLAPGPIDNDTDNDTDLEGGEKSDEEDYEEELHVAHRLLPSFVLSPDPEDLPAPFFHSSRDPTPSSHAFVSLSPDACELPQPRFDSDPYSPASNASSWSSRTGSSESIVSPDAEDLPPPDFEIYDRLEVGGFEFPGPLDHHQDRLGEGRIRDRPRRGLGEGLWKIITGAGKKLSRSGHRRKWLGWT